MIAFWEYSGCSSLPLQRNSTNDHFGMARWNMEPEIMPLNSPRAAALKAFGLARTLDFCVCCVRSRFGRVQRFVTPWAAAHQAPLSMGFPRQEYWSGVPLPSPGDVPDPAIKHSSLTYRTLAGGLLVHNFVYDILYNLITYTINTYSYWYLKNHFH